MNSVLLIGMPAGGEWLVIIVLGLIPVICIVDAMNSKFREPTMKWVWCAVVVFFPLLGSLAYYYIGREQRVIS